MTSVARIDLGDWDAIELVQAASVMVAITSTTSLRTMLTFP
jgi:hypothetical protein